MAPEQVLVTNGSLQADAFLFDHLVQPGDAVVVERPTYDRTLLNLRNKGGQVHAVTTQAGRHRHRRAAQAAGVGRTARSSRTSSRTTRTRPASRSRWPSGTRCSTWPREYGFTIFEDDPYADIRFRGEPLPSMLSLDEHGVVVHASSFTKTVCPGVRVGYLVGPAPLIAEIAKTRDQPLHLARHGVAGDRPPVLRLR